MKGTPIPPTPEAPFPFLVHPGNVRKLTAAQVQRATAQAKKELVELRAANRRRARRMDRMMQAAASLVAAHLEYEATVEAAARKRPRVNRRAMQEALAFLREPR